MLEILFDCTDSSSRSAIGDLFKYLLCAAKIFESEQLADQQSATQTISARYMIMLTSHLFERGAKSWARFEKYMELFSAFALYSPSEVIESIKTSKIENWSRDSAAAKIGLEYFFRTNMLEILLDFVL